MTAPNDTAREASLLFVAPLVALAMGHVLSNAVRTLPAIAADLLGRDLGVTAQGIASLTGAYHFAFALAQIPIGVALDRFGVRRVSLTLLSIVAVGSVIAALAGGPAGFLIGQVVLGAGCGGMLICPMTLAAKTLTPARFGLWSGLIQALGNCGMLLSASPLALLVESSGWRAGYWTCLAIALLVLGLVAALVRDAPAAAPERSLVGDAREVLRLAASPLLRGPVAITFASFAIVIGVRGLWGGPWLMEVKDLSRIEAGNVLLIATLSLCLGPAFWGVVDRQIGRRRALLAFGHLAAAACLVLVVAGGPGGPLGATSAAADTALLFLFGLLVSVQPLAFALTRAAVPPAQVGKAMSAVNMSFFLGAAILQAASGPVVAMAGIGSGLLFFSAATVVCTAWFLVATRPGAPGR
ncbi:MFS transporter [Muricoccus radiodurans]|uniref:MFS transporter n=1 Tax=Muricoccus radiodurans TaxID=2231721 RepID=UPI003CEB0AF9